MKPEKQDSGGDRFVDLLIESLSVGVLILGAVMVGVSWRGWDGPSVSSVLLLLTGAVLFAGHNICLYLEDFSTDILETIAEVREAGKGTERPTGSNQTESDK